MCRPIDNVNCFQLNGSLKFIELKLHCNENKQSKEMFSGAAESQKSSFLEQTKAAREERAFEKKRENAIVYIQAQIRGWLVRKKNTQRIL